MNIQSMRGFATPRAIAAVALLVMAAAAAWLLTDGPQRASAVPGNDNFASATTLTAFGKTNQDNIGATTEGGEPTCSTGASTVWFKYTHVTDDANFSFNTNGSQFDTVLAVYNGTTLPTLVSVGCQNVVSGVGTETVNFQVRAGVTYYVQVGGAGGATGNLTLNFGGGTVSTGVPRLVNYQGRLTNPSTGNPVADGGYVTTFRIFDSLAGGTQLWTETQNVAVSGGLFNVLLGQKTALEPSVFGGTNRFLEVQVGAEPAMTPRQRLASVPYAMQADTLTSREMVTSTCTVGFGVPCLATAGGMTNWSAACPAGKTLLSGGWTHSSAGLAGPPAAAESSPHPSAPTTTWNVTLNAALPFGGTLTVFVICANTN